jgi:hypothetical protein
MLIPRKDKFGFRVSSFKMIPECEFMFGLAQDWELEQTDAMRDGKLFESYVFGFKDEETQSKLEGRKKQFTLDALKEKASNIKQYLKDGQSWDRIQTVVNGKVVSGEPDYVGNVIVDGEEFEAIADLKNTGDIFKLWDGLESRFDYFQSIGYNWLRWRNGLSVLPFVYFVNENKADDSIVRPIVIEITMQDIFWCEELITKYTSEMFLDFNPDRCKGRTYKENRCQYCSKCPYGKSLLTDTVRIKFSELYDPLELKVNEQHKFDAVKQEKQKVFNPKGLDNSDLLEETNIDEMIKKPEFITYGKEEFDKKELLKCRHCFKDTIRKDSEQCHECRIKIKMI